MSSFLALSFGILLAALAAATARGPLSPKDTGGFIQVSVLHFTKEGTLFLADSKGGVIYAYRPTLSPSGAPFPSTHYNIRLLGDLLASALDSRFSGTASSSLIVRDMVVHPMTQEAYLAVERMAGGQIVPAVAVVDQSGRVQLMDLDAFFMKQEILDAPTQETVFWGKTSIRSMTFTGMDFHDNKLYVAGLSNGDFSAVLRVLDYPFGGMPTTTSVEIYHPTHGQNETRAPIRAMRVVTLEGTDYLLAVFTCTPLVLIPLSALRNGAHVIGKTVAELGYGNTPVDMLEFTAQDFEGNNFEVIFISNKEKSSEIISLSDLAKAAKEPGQRLFQTPAGLKRKGVMGQNVPVSGLLHVDVQDKQRLLAVRRNGENGNLELVSYPIGLYIRLSDFISEFDWPDYRYPDLPVPQFLMPVQDKMTVNEGFHHERKNDGN